jgi:hypothetical protein
MARTPLASSMGKFFTITQPIQYQIAPDKTNRGCLKSKTDRPDDPKKVV